MLTVDIDVDARAALLRFGGDFEKCWIAAQVAGEFIGRIDHFGGIGADQRVLIQRAAGAGGNLDVLRRLEINRHPGNVGNRVFQPFDDHVHMCGA